MEYRLRRRDCSFSHEVGEVGIQVDLSLPILRGFCREHLVYLNACLCEKKV